MLVYVIIAVRNLLQARRRTLLLSLALGLVTALLVLLLSLAQGMTDTMIRSATILTSGHVNVAGFFKTKPSDRTPVIVHAKAVRELVAANVAGLDYVIDRHRGFARIISERDSLQSLLAGINVEEETRFLEQLQLAKQSEYVEGGAERVVGDPQRLREPDTVLLFAAQAKRLGVDVGDMLTLSAPTPAGQSNTGEVRVVAVAKDIGFLSNWSVFVPNDTIERLYRVADDTTGVVMVYLHEPADAPAVMARLRQVLEDNGHALRDYSPQPYWMKFETVAGESFTGQRFDLTTWEDEMGPLKWTLTAIDAVSSVLVAILTIIIVIGIMNAMWIAVRERTGEVGTLRAIGMGRARVLLMFSLEALILGLFATSLGAAFGAAVAAGLDAAEWRVPSEAVRAILMSDVLNLSLVPSQIFLAIGTFTAVAVLAALWPAAKAARMRPVTAIQHMG